MEPLQFRIDQRVAINNAKDTFNKVIPRIPSNVIIHKTITGIGATTTEIKDERHSILVLPNVATILNKRDKHEGSFAVYEFTSLSELTDYLKDDAIPYQKLLTTPESLFKILNCCRSVGIDPYAKYFLLFDESHKLIQDVGYRPNITRAMEAFFAFKSKAMVSATPMFPSDPRFVKAGFKTIKLEPSFSYRKPIELFIHNNHIQALIQVIERNPDAKQCIFFNSINGIRDILKKLVHPEFDMISNTSIFCSKEGAHYLNHMEVDGRKPYKAFAAFKPNDMSRFNFFTSSFYNGLDIELDELPQVILITDRNDPKTYFDPYTDSIQAIGRFRKNRDSNIEDTFKDEVVHLINDGPIRPERKSEEVSQWLKAERNVYDSIYTLSRSNPNYLERDIYHESLKRLLFHKYLIDDSHLKYSLLDSVDENINEPAYKIDHFKIDHLFETERIKSYYTHPRLLWQAYVESGFDANAKDDHRPFEVFLNSREYNEANATTPLLKLSLRGGKRYSKDNVKRMLTFLENAETISSTPEYDKIVFRVTDPYALVRFAYDKLGPEKVKELDYSITKIRQALIDYDVKTGKNKEPVIDSVYHKFPLNVRLKHSYIKKELQLIYQHYNMSIKAKATDMKQWFVLKETKFATFEKDPMALTDKSPKIRVDHRAYVLLAYKFNEHRMLIRT